jgi:bacteriocin biosynthesis cyclodehydratase domain-containing protein
MSFAMADPSPSMPLLAPWFRRAAAPDRLLFGYGDEVVTLEGQAVTSLLPRLLPLLDGTRDADQLVAELGEAVRPAVERALGVLADEGLVVDGPPVPAHDPARAAALLLASQLRTSAPRAIADAITSARVEVRGSGSAAAAMATTLAASGLPAVRGGIGDPTDVFDLVVVAPAPGELLLLADWNRTAIRDEIPWMLVLPFDGASALVGPIFVRPETACLECLRIRRAANLPFADELRELDRSPATYPAPAFVDAILAGLGALAVLRWLAVRDPLFVGAGYTLELGRTVGLTRHVVYPVPRCPECSPLATSGPITPWFG